MFSQKSMNFKFDNDSTLVDVSNCQIMESQMPVVKTSVMNEVCSIGSRS